MQYSTRIEDYLAAIEGCEAFFVAEREHFKIINYISMGNDVFPDPNTAPDAETARKWLLRRQCRGLIFSHAGDVISLPIHKFFNVSERDETQLHRIDLDRQHVILSKLDGSMVRPIPVGDGYRLGTKMSMTDVSMQAEVWLADHPNYDLFIRSCFESNCIPIFEWCSRKQTIVVDHPVDRLVLIAIRSIITGDYMGIPVMRGIAEAMNIDLVSEYPGTVESMAALVAETETLIGQEGWVIRFDDGDMLKIKADDYRRKHSAKDSITMEKNVIEMILAEKLDDCKSVLDIDLRRRLEQFETDFWHGIRDTGAQWALAFYDVKRKFGDDRKAFAIEWAPGFESNLRSAMFRAWDAAEFDWQTAIVDAVKKNLGTQTKVDAARGMWGGAKWAYGGNTGDDE